MKKLIPLLLLLSACSLSYAESMKFITVLSSPVGTFNKLEAVDPAQPAKGNTVNFCTNIGTQGVVELKGTKPAALTTVSLARNTTLGNTDEGKFSLNNITLKQGGSLRGGRLFGNTLKVDYKASGKASNLYGNTLMVAGAKTNNLTVTNSSYIKKGEQNSAVLTNPPDMVWSNQYQDDDACKSGSACAKQYLLKSGGVSGSEEDSGSKCTHCTAYEKGSSAYNNCVKNSVINIDRQCCREAYSLFPAQAEKQATKCWLSRQVGTDYNKEAKVDKWAFELEPKYPSGSLPVYIFTGQEKSVTLPDCSGILTECPHSAIGVYDPEEVCLMECFLGCNATCRVDVDSDGRIQFYYCKAIYSAPFCQGGWYGIDYL